MISDATFFDIARTIARHGTCSRLNVGSLIVRDNRIVSTGYNGSAQGLPHCHHDDDLPCHASVHSEVNAIAFAARHGVATLGAAMYCTHCPCDHCAGIIINSGIRTVVYETPYRNDRGIVSLMAAGVEVVKWEDNQ